MSIFGVGCGGDARLRLVEFAPQRLRLRGDAALRRLRVFSRSPVRRRGVLGGVLGERVRGRGLLRLGEPRLEARLRRVPAGERLRDAPRGGRLGRREALLRVRQLRLQTRRLGHRVHRGVRPRLERLRRLRDRRSTRDFVRLERTPDLVERTQERLARRLRLFQRGFRLLHLRERAGLLVHDHLAKLHLHARVRLELPHAPPGVRELVLEPRRLRRAPRADSPLVVVGGGGVWASNASTAGRTPPGPPQAKATTARRPREEGILRTTRAALGGCVAAPAGVASRPSRGVPLRAERRRRREKRRLLLGHLVLRLREARLGRGEPRDELALALPPPLVRLRVPVRDARAQLRHRRRRLANVVLGEPQARVAIFQIRLERRDASPGLRGGEVPRRPRLERLDAFPEPFVLALRRSRLLLVPLSNLRVARLGASRHLANGVGGGAEVALRRLDASVSLRHVRFEHLDRRAQLQGLRFHRFHRGLEGLEALLPPRARARGLGRARRGRARLGGGALARRGSSPRAAVRVAALARRSFTSSSSTRRRSASIVSSAASRAARTRSAAAVSANCFVVRAAASANVSRDSSSGRGAAAPPTRRVAEASTSASPEA